MEMEQWVGTYSALLRTELHGRGIDLDPSVAVEFITRMVEFIAEGAGAGEAQARAIVTPAAIPGWADSLAGLHPTADEPDSLLIAAHTVAEAAAALMELNRAASDAERLADLAGLGVTHYDGDVGALRDEALNLRSVVSDVSAQLASHLLSQQPADLVSVPADLHGQLCRLLERSAGSPVLDIAESEPGGVYYTTVDGPYTLRDVVSATVHDLDSASRTP